MIAETLGFSSAIPPRLEAARRLQAATAARTEARANSEATQSALDQRSQLHAQRAESQHAEREIVDIERALTYRQRQPMLQ